MEKHGSGLFLARTAGALAAAAIFALSTANAGEPTKGTAHTSKAKGKDKREQSSDGKPLSDKKFAAINKLINEYLNAGEDLKDSTVQKAIFEEIKAKFPVKESSAPVNIDTDAVASLVRKKLEAKFPESIAAFIKRQRLEAKQLFQTAKIKEHVKVEYQQGDTVYAVSGTYYGITPGGKSIDIGNRQVPIVDLLPEYQAKVYERFCAEKRREHVSQKLREYQQERNACSAEIYAKIREELSRKNESNGYIEVWQKWRTPVNVAEILLRDLVDKNAKPGEISAKTDVENPEEMSDTEETDSGLAGDAGDSEMTDSEVAEPDFQNSSSKRPLEERRKDAEKLAARKLEDIRLRNSGIDADQGYKLATWGMSRSQVCLLFSPKLDPDAPKSSDMEKVSFNKGFLSDLELYFVNDKLYKVIATFRIGAPEAMSGIFENIKSRYGISDEERKLRTKRLVEGKAAKPVEEVPTEATYNWTGAVTKGRLYVKFDKAAGNYSLFQLTKENPILKKTEEEKILAERAKAEKEAKNRQIEKAKEFKDF